MVIFKNLYFGSSYKVDTNNNKITLNLIPQSNLDFFKSKLCQGISAYLIMSLKYWITMNKCK